MASAFVHLQQALLTGWMGEWRSGSAAALHAVGRGFESLFAYHFPLGNSHFFGPLHNIAKCRWCFHLLLSRVALLKIIICKRGSDSLFACNSKFIKSASALASLQKDWTVEGGYFFNSLSKRKLIWDWYLISALGYFRWASCLRM